MVDSARRVPAWAVLALGFVLAWLPLFWNVWPAWIGVALAQPALIIGWGRLRGERALPWREDAIALLLLWGLSAALLALVVALPLEALRESGALLPALGLSVSAGLVLLGLWRWWPSYALAIRSGARFSRLIAVSGSAGKADAARGLAMAGLVLGVLALVLSLAWPGLLPAVTRWGLLIAQPFLALLAYAAIHRFGAAPIAKPAAPSKLAADD